MLSLGHYREVKRKQPEFKLGPPIPFPTMITLTQAKMKIDIKTFPWEKLQDFCLFFQVVKSANQC